MGTAARGRAFAVGLATACAIGVAGCSADPDDQPTDATPASPTPTDDQTEPPGNQVTEPTLPADAEGGSIRSAKAFVGYYIDLLNYAMVTGDTKSFRAASQQSCSGCADYVDFVDGIYSDGGYYRTAGWRDLKILLGGQRDAVLFTVTATATPVRYRMSTNGQVKRSARERFDFAISVREVNDEWTAAGISAS